METSQVIQSLYSLWFFTNILSPKPHQISNSSSDQKLIENTTNKKEKKELSTPVNPILENEQNVSPSAENYALRCPKCGHFSKPVDNQEMDIPKSAEIKKVRKRRRSRSKRMLDFGFSKEKFSSESWMFKDAWGYQKVFSPCRMPPIGDDTAMKQHLKSWAYAVAWSLR